MDQETLNLMTTFDNLIQSKQLLILKAAIPYLSGNSQKALSIFAKYYELIKTMQISQGENSALSMCSVTTENPSDKPLQFLKDIRCYCNDAEKETIDFFVDFFQIYETYENFMNWGVILYESIYIIK